jgi:3-oxoadipate enol-lactonase
MQQMWRDRAVLVRECGMAPVVDPTLELWFTGEARAAEMPVVATTRSLLSAADPDGYAWACDLLASADTRGLLPAIKAPVLVVCGDQDAPAFTEAAPALAATVPDGRLSWLAGARHGAAFERPRELADLLMAFSADVRG